jgi:NAD(P)-dependent dehydrogenase (short-subunit alcohol dehydrogenase family)
MDADAIDLADMLRHVDINYAGALHLLDAVLPHLLRATHGGRLRQPGGQRGRLCGLPHSLAYGPTKAALINLAQTLYLDLRDKGVGVSIINPGFVETPLTAQNQFHMPALMSAPSRRHSAILEGWARASSRSISRGASRSGSRRWSCCRSACTSLSASSRGA